MLATASLANEFHFTFQYEEYARRRGTLAPEEPPRLPGETGTVFEEDGPGLWVIVEKVDTFVIHEV
jgi:hypothetical protein